MGELSATIRAGSDLLEPLKEQWSRSRREQSCEQHSAQDKIKQNDTGVCENTLRLSDGWTTLDFPRHLQSRVSLNISGAGANSSTSRTGPGSNLLFSSRRGFLKSLSRSALVLSFEGVLELARPHWLQANPRLQQNTTPAKAETQAENLGVSFINIGRESGLNAKTVFGGEHKNKYLLETTGCGVAFYDYDNDGWLDIFLVNGSRLEGFAGDAEPPPHLFRKNRDGILTDFTPKAGA